MTQAHFEIPKDDQEFGRDMPFGPEMEQRRIAWEREELSKETLVSKLRREIAEYERKYRERRGQQ